MPTLKIELQGDDVIDNASIYLEDPHETIEYKLDPESDTTWTKQVSLPVNGSLEYSLYVVAFTGTHFTCTITDVGTERKIKLEGITGPKNRAHIQGSQNF